MKIGDNVRVKERINDVASGEEGVVIDVAYNGLLVVFSRGKRFCMNSENLELIKEEKSALQIQEGGDHYKNMKIQPIEYIHANNLPFPEGCIIKYVSRWRAKNGIKDLEKARHFIDLLIELESRCD